MRTILPAAAASCAALSLALVVAACGKTTNDPAPVLTFSPASGTQLPTGRVNASYSHPVSVVAGGEMPFTFVLQNGPPGLSIAPNGSSAFTLSGTPTSAGLFLVSFTATDARARTTNGSYTVRVDPAGGTLAIAPTTLANGQRPQPYSQVFSTTGVTPIAWGVSGSPPPGLSFAPSTGQTFELSGTPTTAGSFSFSVNVQDSSSPPRTGSATYTVTIN